MKGHSAKLEAPEKDVKTGNGNAPRNRGNGKNKFTAHGYARADRFSQEKGSFQDIFLVMDSYHSSRSRMRNFRREQKRIERRLWYEFDSGIHGMLYNGYQAAKSLSLGKGNSGSLGEDIHMHIATIDNLCREYQFIAKRGWDILQNLEEYNNELNYELKQSAVARKKANDQESIATAEYEGLNVDEGNHGLDDLALIDRRKKLFDLKYKGRKHMGVVLLASLQQSECHDMTQMTEIQLLDFQNFMVTCDCLSQSLGNLSRHVKNLTPFFLAGGYFASKTREAVSMLESMKSLSEASFHYYDKGTSEIYEFLQRKPLTGTYQGNQARMNERFGRRSGYLSQMQGMVDSQLGNQGYSG